MANAKNKTWQDAFRRVGEARKDSLRDASVEYLRALEAQLTGWLENVRDMCQATADLFDLSDVDAALVEDSSHLN